jgi:Tfp pilus assembly protein PilO
VNQVTLYTRIAQVGIVIGIMILLFNLFGPRPQAAANVRNMPKELAKLESKEKLIREDIKKLREANEARLMTGSVDALSASVMQTLEQFTRQSNVRMVSFRPQRTEEEAGLIRLPFQLVVEGSFLKVINLLQTVETPKTKISVSSVQMTSTDGATDLVTATVGLVAYTTKDGDNKEGVVPNTSSTTSTTKTNP